MSSPIEDFVVSLGFDLTKIKPQIDQLHTMMNKLASKADTERIKQGKAREKVIADEAIKQTKRVAKVKEKVETQAEKKEKARAEKAAKLDKSTNRQRLERTARNVVAEYERSTVGPSNAGKRLDTLVKTNASNAQIRAFIESMRGSNDTTRNRMKAEGLLKSFDSGSSAKAELDMFKARSAITTQKALMDALGMDTKGVTVEGKTLDQLKMYNAQLQEAVKLHKIQNRESKVKAFVGPTAAGVDTRLMQTTKYSTRLQGVNMSQLKEAAMVQPTARAANAYVTAAEHLNRYRNVNASKVDAAINSGSIESIRATARELSAVNAQLEKQRRHAIGAAAAMGSLQDSTRNMVREYASLYTLLAGTYAIKEQAKALDGVAAGMTAVSANAEEVAHNIKFVTDEAIKNGLSIKDAGKDYTKLKASIGDKLGLKETEEMFQSLTKAGVVFQLSQDDMTGTIRA